MRSFRLARPAKPAIRGGFRHPQSQRLTGYGVVGVIVMLLAVLVDWLFPNLLSLGRSEFPQPQSLHDPITPAAD